MKRIRQLFVLLAFFAAPFAALADCPPTGIAVADLYYGNATKEQSEATLSRVLTQTNSPYNPQSLSFICEYRNINANVAFRYLKRQDNVNLDSLTQNGWDKLETVRAGWSAWACNYVYPGTITPTNKSCTF